MEKKSINDAEREELFCLRAQVQKQQEEILKLRAQLSKYEDEPPKKENLAPAKIDIANEEQLEKEIEKLNHQIEKHRNEKNGKCWFFGIKNLKFDYGEVWSSPSYWRSLINANQVTEKFCLFSFCFQKDSKCCEDCSKKVDNLNELFLIYLGNLKKKYNL